MKGTVLIMKKAQRIFAIVFLAMVCVSSTVFAVPVKEDTDSEIKITVTSKPTATATVKPTAKATASAKPTSTATTKPTATVKPTSTVKATATAKATNDDDEDKVTLESEEEAIVIETTQEPTLNIQNNSEQLENSKYLTKGGAFMWFLFTVIVSAVISFAISYRFYMMGKRDNHIVSELRALKRDIDSKMVGTVGGFSEYDVTVTNNNRSYAKENSSIKSGKAVEDEDDNNEIYKKWETQINNAQSGRSAGRNTYSRSASRTNNTRMPERRRPSKNVTVGGKIKNIISDFFPTDKK